MTRAADIANFATSIKTGTINAATGTGNVSIGANTFLVGAQNSIKIPGQIIRVYYAEQTTGFTSTSSSWVNTGLTFSNVVISSDEGAIYQWYFTIRRGDATDPHVGSRLVYTGSASNNFPNESNSWGFGIMGRGQGLEWGIHSGLVNLRSARGGYSSFNPNGTYNFQHQVRSTGGQYHIGSEISGSPAEYTVNHGIFWIYKT